MTIIVNTDMFRIESYSNGLAYDMTSKVTWDSIFLQGDCALQFESELEALETAHINSESVYYDMTWNQCLSELFHKYL